MYTYMHASVYECIYRHAVHRYTHTHAHLRTHTPHKHAHATRTHHTHTRKHTTRAPDTHTHTTHTHLLTDILLWNMLAVSNEGQQQQERRRRECKREHFTEGERREADGVCVRESGRECSCAHTYIRTYMCVECWVHLHVHYGTHTSRRSCFLQHHTRNTLTSN